MWNPQSKNTKLGQKIYLERYSNRSRFKRFHSGTQKSAQKSEAGFQFLVSPLHLAVGLEKPDGRLTEIPSRRQNSTQNLALNWGPLSDTVSWGMPWRWKSLCRGTKLSILKEVVDNNEYCGEAILRGKDQNHEEKNHEKCEIKCDMGQKGD